MHKHTLVSSDSLLLIASLAAALTGGCGGDDQAPRSKPSESVVVVHGMGRTRGSMALLAWRLEQAGYEAHNFPYSHRTANLDELSEGLHSFIRARVETPTYHLIGHSLGNVIIRNGFKDTYRTGLKRIVMIAPPNQPPELAQLLEENRLYRWVTGDSGQKLADQLFYRDLPIPTVEFGIIAGDKGHQVGLDGPNDGVIKVEHTKLRGMTDWVLVHRTHTFIMIALDTFQYCQRFLETGAFQQGEP